MDNVKSVVAFINEKGQLLYLSEEGVSTTIQGAKKFDDWGIARNEIYDRNPKRIAWFVFHINEKTENCTVRDCMCHSTTKIPE